LPANPRGCFSAEQAKILALARGDNDRGAIPDQFQAARRVVDPRTVLFAVSAR
jgi:hypothetical protein